VHGHRGGFDVTEGEADLVLDQLGRNVSNGRSAQQSQTRGEWATSRWWFHSESVAFADRRVYTLEGVDVPASHETMANAGRHRKEFSDHRES